MILASLIKISLFRCRTRVGYFILAFGLVSCTGNKLSTQPAGSINDLHFDQLATVWDEGIPLGNGLIGALVWRKDGKLRLSLDRADLWDLRPMENLNTKEWKYSWVYEQWKKNDYKPVQDKFDVPYDRSPAPSKIPGAALEFDISSLGEVESVHLFLEEAICQIVWKSGVKMEAFVHAEDPVGWFRFEGLNETLTYDLIPPAYNLEGKAEAENPVTGQDLRRLGYPPGKVAMHENNISYVQEGWGGFRYEVCVDAISDKTGMQGCWSIASQFPTWSEKISARETVSEHLTAGLPSAMDRHRDWWNEFWAKSSLSVPDLLLQKQWYLEQYKFGSAARQGAPPISLQAVWTADNGKLPPWKGDFHHDLNTQLSYWPAYSANHLDEEMGFINWLWNHRDTFRNYTEQYYQATGLNVPGVTTLVGQPMGGWIQYSFGPTVSAWLSHHFYLHWQFTKDRQFLEDKAYPWIKDVATFIDHISIEGDNGWQKLPISSSPEIYNNSREAWFGETTNFDLALIRFAFEKAAELAAELGKADERNHWESLLAKWPELAVDENTGLMFSPKLPYNESHRHFSHQIGFHPLGLIDYSKGERHRHIIENTINTLDQIGTGEWVGYSFSWLANLKARAFDGSGAADALRIFASSFCLPNSFHVNGDQSGKGYSNFTYRPFTLEGNFAFASALQEMLLQSHTGTLLILPAVPEDWKEIEFNQLRTEGAFLVSAKKEKGILSETEIVSTAGGVLRLKNPFGNAEFDCSMKYTVNENDELLYMTNPGDVVKMRLHNGK